MSIPVAAQAAEFELSPDGDIDFDQLVEEGAMARLIGGLAEPNPMIARDALLAIAQAESEAAELQTIKSQIVQRYDERAAVLAGRISRARETLNAYVERFGKVTFPDVGGAHQTTRNKGGKVKVVDAVALRDWMESNDYETPLIEREPLFDIEAAIDIVAKSMKCHAHPDGKLVSYETGEVLEIPGITVEAEAKTLAVRKS